MQVAGSVYPASQLVNPYYHPPVPSPHDHELKRQYLALLPPQQIIEICLTFDLHVSPYIKSTIWPLDINAAIAGLSKSEEATAKTAENAPHNGDAIMDSLVESESEASPGPDDAPDKPAEEPRPPDKDVVEEPVAGPSTASTASTPAPATPAPAQATPAPQPPPPPQHVQPPPPMAHAYSHQPYGYPYPHTPYYPPPPTYPYSHPQYPPYPQYPQPPQAAGYPPPPASMYPPPPAPHMPPPLQDGNAGDDLPSYEEMIVEALTDNNDPEGCAPKDLFTWMAARYPLQSNFRPSASQALQKAYKRGRLEKSSNNKYRLNAAWEGGNTSRRTTRRPQTHPHTSSNNNQISSSPFTNTPLVHHHHNQHQPQQQQSYPQHNFGYNYSQPTPYSNQQATQQSQPTASTSATPAVASAEPKSTNVPDTASSDAYEAAQSILKAINFGNLLQLPTEETQEGVGEKDTAAKQVTHVPPVASSSSTMVGVIKATSATVNVDAAARADLQAHLALLAAQLTELSKIDDSAPTVEMPPPHPHPIAPQQMLSLPQQQQQQPISQPHQPMQGLMDLPHTTNGFALPPPPPPSTTTSAPLQPPPPILALDPQLQSDDEDDDDSLEMPEGGETESDDDDMEAVI